MRIDGGDGLAGAAVGLEGENVGAGAGLDVEGRHFGGGGLCNWLEQEWEDGDEVDDDDGSVVGFLKVGCCTEAGAWSQFWWGSILSCINLE